MTRPCRHHDLMISSFRLHPGGVLPEEVIIGVRNCGAARRGSRDDWRPTLEDEVVMQRPRTGRRRAQEGEGPMSLSPFALHMLGVDMSERPRGREEQTVAGPEAARNMTEPQAPRPSRRPTSHYNSFQTICSPATDDPPTYAAALRHRVPQRDVVGTREKLPPYTCTVATEAKVQLQVESTNPLHGVSEGDWRDVHLVLRGTLLSFHKVKESGTGKLLRSYTLQHAEIGLATDTQHTILIPQTRIAHLVPPSQRKRAWQKDPDLFKPVRQTVVRLRLETDQLLLADSSEERIFEIIHAISTGVDVAHAIDERSIPKQCTMPRRRRRQRSRPDGDLNDPTLLAEQERILREMYPSFAESADRQTTEMVRTASQDVPPEPLPSPVREEDDLDLAVIREDFAQPNEPAPTPTCAPAVRPDMSRRDTASTVASTRSALATCTPAPENFDESGKWWPPHPRTEAQIQRYIRRCMPVLTAEAVRASDVLIHEGKRVRINWRMELLEEWSLQPPSYKAHDFASSHPLERSKSRASVAPSATHSTPHSSRSALGSNADSIEPVESSLANLELSKAMSITDKGGSAQGFTLPQAAATKKQEPRPLGTEVHGVVFCF